MKLDRDVMVNEVVRSRDNPDMHQYGGAWQVVLERGELDYCRETLSDALTFNEVVEWATMTIKHHPGITSAVIEWF